VLQILSQPITSAKDAWSDKALHKTF